MRCGKLGILPFLVKQCRTYHIAFVFVDFLDLKNQSGEIFQIGARPAWIITVPIFVCGLQFLHKTTYTSIYQLLPSAAIVLEHDLLRWHPPRSTVSTVKKYT